MTHSQALREQLIRHEGLRLRPYRDTSGRLTIGVGRNLDDKGITKAEALELLENDISECLTDLVTFPWFERLDAVRQRVVIDMRFNLGPSKFREFKQTIAAIADGRYGRAADHMLASKWAGQVGKRAETLAAMMRTGIASDGAH